MAQTNPQDRLLLKQCGSEDTWAAASRPFCECSRSFGDCGPLDPAPFHAPLVELGKTCTSVKLLQAAQNRRQDRLLSTPLCAGRPIRGSCGAMPGRVGPSSTCIGCSGSWPDSDPGFCDHCQISADFGRPSADVVPTPPKSTGQQPPSPKGGRPASLEAKLADSTARRSVGFGLFRSDGAVAPNFAEHPSSVKPTPATLWATPTSDFCPRWPTSLARSAGLYSTQLQRPLATGGVIAGWCMDMRLV